MTKSLCYLTVCALLITLSGAAALAAPADDSSQPAPAGILSTILQEIGTSSADPASGGDGSYSWFKTVDHSQEEQPHWMTPVVTVTPRLEEEYRYDQVGQIRPGNADLTNYGNTKGIELIPLEHVEVILGVPGYETLTSPGGTKTGWADDTFLVKYRIMSNNEENGNDILTAFLGVQVPTGSPAFTDSYTIYTPTIAGGKGWGTRAEGFDIQSTLGYSIPGSNEKSIGEQLIWNTAFQAHVFSEHIWPELELNYTHFHDGDHDGKNQLFYTLGFVAGRFPISGRVRLALGAGYQQALTAFRMYNHAFVLTLRAPF